eukprot:TRINITY_DN75085_c0_g1_i1.p1 TRINITY_DN75085_c0_g1~~TRINITY_DN75085_c0_g1_i1.p1  ORF type:complete len:309 (-),score=39.08 TRINITY_DN75085_c0_g1_i1:84-1010(-)
MAGGAYPRPPATPRDSSDLPTRPARRPPLGGASVRGADGVVPINSVSGKCLLRDGSVDNRMQLLSQRSEDIGPRPHTHCGASLRSHDDDDDAETLGRVGPGALALLSVRDGCRCCAKLRLRLEHEERARVKTQEQLARVQGEYLAMRRRHSEGGESTGDASQRCDSTIPPLLWKGSEAGAEDPALEVPGERRGDVTPVDTPRTISCPGDDVTRILEGYRREVGLLRMALLDRDARESSMAEEQRREREQHLAAKRDWEAQVAVLLCDVHDLETRNRDLENNLCAQNASSRGAMARHASDRSSPLRVCS